MRLMRHGWHRWVAPVFAFASAALGAACSNSSSGGQGWEEPQSHPPPVDCSICTSPDGAILSPDGAVATLNVAPDGAILDLDAGAICVAPFPCVIPPAPVEAGGM